MHTSYGTHFISVYLAHESSWQKLKKYFDFRMKIGTNKTQLITPSSVQSVLDKTSGDLEELATVDDYRYL